MSSDNVLLEPGHKIRPSFDKSAVSELISRLYGMRVLSVKEMNSYDDRNFHVVVEGEEANGAEYTLKISNAIDSDVPQLIEDFNGLLTAAHQSGLVVPLPIAVSGGQGTVSRVKLTPTDEQQYAVRLFTFIPGKMLIEIPYEADVLYKVGVELGKMTSVFEKYRSEVLEKRNSIWSLINTPKLKPFLFAVKNEENKALVQQVLASFEQQVFGVLNQLPSGIIHGDFNEQNILLSKCGGKGWQVCGLLDFGDVHKAPYLFDLAILCAYSTLECRTMDPLLAPGHCIAGYKSVRSLSDLECSLIPICIAARLCQSLVLGAYSHLQDPGNEYILTTARTGWTILRNLRDKTDHALLNEWYRLEALRL